MKGVSFARDEDDRNAEKRLHDAAQCAVDKGFHPAQAFQMQRQCNGGPFGEVLYADAERESAPAATSPCRCCAVRRVQTTGRRPSFGNIVQSHQYKLPSCVGTSDGNLCARRAVVQMRQQAVQQQR